MSAAGRLVAPGGIASNGYIVDYITGTLTVNQKNLNVTGLTGTVSKTYNANTTATLASNNYTTDAINGDNVSVSTTSGSYDTKNVGTGKTVTVSSLGITGADAGDYNLLTASASGAVGTITAKALTVSADNKSITYGGADPALTYAYTGLAGSDSSASFTGTLDRAAGNNAGTYSIMQNTLAASGNYTIGTYKPGVFTITGGAPITIPNTVTMVSQAASLNVLNDSYLNSLVICHKPDTFCNNSN